MAKAVETVAIIGGGPAGATLGALLARKSFRVGLFRLPQRPRLIVGESLLPSVMPILRLLGIEDHVRQFGTFKGGATITLNEDEEASFSFNLAGTELQYAYNVPRDLFDEAILGVARREGVRIFEQRAVIELDQTGRPRLSKETLSSTDGFFGSKIDLIVDSSGRARLFPKLLGLPATRGKRDDVALFAHHESIALSDPGNIHLDRLRKGWGWRIPLPGRVSVGIIVAPEHLAGVGDSRETQYDSVLCRDPVLCQFTRDGRRVSPVFAYSNYQWMSKRLYDDGWALVGDSAGFVDPVFSSGVYLAMYGSMCLANALEAGTADALFQYQQNYQRLISNWQSLVDSWYDGSLFTLVRVGQSYEKSWIGRRLNPYMTRHITRVFTGDLPNTPHSYRLLRFMITYGLYGQDTSSLMVH